jgi:TRAP-type C4-dicarboxylate transport system permease small subunit
MRQLLDRAYNGAGYLAGICIVIITIMILVQIVAVHRLSRGWQRALMYFALIVITIITGYGAYHLTYLVYESWIFEELSQGYIAIPLWIPQVPMALGAILFFIALVDDLILSLRGGSPAFIGLEE